MRKIYIGTTFSLLMLNRKCSPSIIWSCPIEQNEAKAMIASGKYEIVSAIGNADTAAVVSNALECNIPANRTAFKLNSNDFLIVAQFTGGKLSAGAKKLPDKMKIEFWLSCLE